MALAMLTLLLCGCGGRKEALPSPLQRGRAVFSASCADCHTLVGHNTQVPGGDLAIAKLRVNQIASFVRIMPVHLSALEVDAVAAYVHAAVSRSNR